MRNVVRAILLSVAAHAALALALVAYFRCAPAPETLATLDLSSVDLSFAERDDETAAVAPSLPSAAEPVPPKPRADEPPPPPEPLAKPLPPDPAAVRFAEPEERPPQMETPEPTDETAAAPEPPPAAAAQPTPAVAPRQAKVEAPPRPHRTIRPDYPKGARQRGEQGDVTLEIRVNDRGRVEEVRVVESCGFPELDGAAVRAAKAARFTPAKAGGEAVPSTARLKLTFRLR